MKIEKTLNVPSPVFFDKIIDSVIFDIRKATGKTVSRKQLAGYEYVKEFSASSRAKSKLKKSLRIKSISFGQRQPK